MFLKYLYVICVYNIIIFVIIFLDTNEKLDYLVDDEKIFQYFNIFNVSVLKKELFIYSTCFLGTTSIIFNMF